jgi:uncharacterized protein
MYFPRIIEKECHNLFKIYPVLTVTGPRQSGKTTLIKHCFPDKPYYNLEAPDVLAMIRDDPRRFFRENPTGALIDEVQNFPKLLSYMQGYVDEKDIPGQFVLTGSQHFAISHTVSQSLAGRTGILTLYPMSIEELQIQTATFHVDDFLHAGFYPRLYKNVFEPEKLYRDYVQTYVERDVRQISQIKELSLFQKCLRLCAGRIGQVLNYNNLANEVGVSVPTIKHWISVLEASYLIILLQPYYRNFNKRIIKSPKLYFTDVGLASFLLGIHTKEQISRDPLRGQLFENLVVIDLMKMFTNRGLVPNFYFYRDNNQHEVDLLIQQASTLLPIEIKSSETFHKSFLTGLHYFATISEQAPQGAIIYAGEHQAMQRIHDYDIIYFKEIDRLLRFMQIEG